MSIQVKNISKMYGRQKALSDISFSISSGEIVGFLGPNGAGKSTMMKIITCFIPQSEGSVSVCGFDVVEQSLDVRTKVGYLPEHNPLYTDMYVKEYLEYAGGAYHIPNIRQRVAEMIDLTGLTNEQNKKIGELSKGYRQRVGIAQALIHDPEVLILDEPTTGLDPNQIVEIRELIKKIGKEKTVMLSTHIMQEVEAVCDRVIIVNNGEIVADAPTSEISNLAKTQNVIKVEFDKAVTAEELMKLKGVSNAVLIEGNQWQVFSNTSDDIRKEVFKHAVATDNYILAMMKEEQSLEKVFRELTK